MKKPNPLWFVNKSYGWGWTPATWQGWLILVIFLGLILLNALRLDQYYTPTLAIEVVIENTILVIALIIIYYVIGEKPEWRWGKR